MRSWTMFLTPNQCSKLLLTLVLKDFKYHTYAAIKRTCWWQTLFHEYVMSKLSQLAVMGVTRQLWHRGTNKPHYHLHPIICKHSSSVLHFQPKRSVFSRNCSLEFSAMSYAHAGSADWLETFYSSQVEHWSIWAVPPAAMATGILQRHRPMVRRFSLRLHQPMAVANPFISSLQCCGNAVSGDPLQ